MGSGIASKNNSRRSIENCERNDLQNDRTNTSLPSQTCTSPQSPHSSTRSLGVAVDPSILHNCIENNQNNYNNSSSLGLSGPGNYNHNCIGISNSGDTGETMNQNHVQPTNR